MVGRDNPWALPVSRGAFAELGGRDDPAVDLQGYKFSLILVNLGCPSPARGSQGSQEWEPTQIDSSILPATLQVVIAGARLLGRLPQT